MMLASEIKPGEFFRLENGTYVYIRLSTNSIVRLGLCEGKIYGVSFNGNVRWLWPRHVVVPSSASAFVKNITTRRKWEKEMGCKTGADSS